MPAGQCVARKLALVYLARLVVDGGCTPQQLQCMGEL